LYFEKYSNNGKKLPDRPGVPRANISASTSVNKRELKRKIIKIFQFFTTSFSIKFF